MSEAKKLACIVFGHAWGDGVQDEPTARDRELIAAALRITGAPSIIWSGGKWTYACKRCGKTERR